MKSTHPAVDPEPRWYAAVAMLGVGGIYAAIPERLMVGPRWLLFAVILILLIPTLLMHQRGYKVHNEWLGFLINGVITAAMIASLIFLVQGLSTHRETAKELLRSTVTLWISNVVVFALWYWRLDAGGPNQREMKRGHSDGAFLFPQMTLPDDFKHADEKAWSPNFIDYLFLSFNTSAAFSPTDAPALSRWAKALMMIQASISLTIIALLAGRSVNILWFFTP